MPLAMARTGRRCRPPVGLPTEGAGLELIVRPWALAETTAAAVDRLCCIPTAMGTGEGNRWVPFQLEEAAVRLPRSSPPRATLEVSRWIRAVAAGGRPSGAHWERGAPGGAATGSPGMKTSEATPVQMMGGRRGMNG
jgi:hypothetical protein